MKFILNEAETFGFTTGEYPSCLDKRVVCKSGGIDGNWGGSMERALEVASWLKPLGIYPGSQKRSKKNTASGRRSDHWAGSTDSYGVDLGCSLSKGDEGYELIKKKLVKLGWITQEEADSSKWRAKRGTYSSFNKDGFRYQVIWRSDSMHDNHIHVGVRNTNKSPSDFKPAEDVKVDGDKKTDSPVVSGIKKIIFTDFPADQEKIIDGVLKKLDSEGLKDNFSKIVLASLVIYNLEESKTITESTEDGSSNAKGFISKIKEKEFTSLDGALDFFEEEFGVTDFNKPEIKKIAEKFKLEVGTDSGTKKIDMELIKKFIAAFDKKYEKYEVAEEVSNNENLNEELTRIKDIMKKIL